MPDYILFFSFEFFTFSLRLNWSVFRGTLDVQTYFGLTNDFNVRLSGGRRRVETDASGWRVKVIPLIRPYSVSRKFRINFNASSVFGPAFNLITFLAADFQRHYFSILTPTVKAVPGRVIMKSDV